MAKAAERTVHVCQSCGSISAKWLGRCPGCGEWNTLVEEVSQPVVRLAGRQPAVAYPTIEKRDFPRIRTDNPEFDRVLGGGVVPGSVVLLGGEPGIGKSTLLLQVAENLSAGGRKILYVAGEESVQQIKLRGERLGVSGRNLFLVGETCIERILEEVSVLQPSFVIVDSIQTVYSERLEAIPGSVGQVRQCAAELLGLAKQKDIPVFLIGHITKEGQLAGPKVLEHIVDTVLYFEGDRHQNQKIVRAVKNRFGPANELGIFQMTSTGLQCVDNPSKLFLSERASHIPGSAILCALQGLRPVLVELQALVSQTNYSTARRMANGVDPNRVSLLLAVLEKRLGLHMLGSDVYVNVVGGLVLQEPALDLAVVVSILSSFREKPVSPGTVVFGEVGLGGEVRAVNSAHIRVREAKAMGFKRVYLPSSNLPPSENVKGVELIGISSLQECLQVLD